MFLDTNFNSVNTVLTSVYETFVESAMKYYRYTKCMTVGTYPHASLLIGMVFLFRHEDRVARNTHFS